jgi:hypothetical protein
MQSAPSVSTPQIRTPGFNALIAVATPAANPPPPTLMTTSPSFALELGDLGEGRGGRCREFHFRAVSSRGLDIVARRRLRHQHQRFQSQRPRDVRHCLRVITSADRDNSPPALLRFQAQRLVERAPHFERSSLLKQLQLHVDVRLQALA